MADKICIGWMSAPAQKRADASGMTIDEMIETLEKTATPETAAACGEIKGLYGAYKLAPSNLLLEAIIAKCLTIIINISPGANLSVASTPLKINKNHLPSMDWEWVQGFEHFLLLNVISETTRQVYIRAIKRVMKNYSVTDVNLLKDNIDWYIDQYDGKDQAAHNVHLAALRQFKKFINDGCGYFISVELNSEEEIVSRIYCTLALARSEYQGIIDEYRNTAKKARLYDKFATLIEEVIF